MLPNGFSLKREKNTEANNKTEQNARLKAKNTKTRHEEREETNYKLQFYLR